MTKKELGAQEAVQVYIGSSEVQQIVVASDRSRHTRSRAMRRARWRPACRDGQAAHRASPPRGASALPTTPANAPALVETRAPSAPEALEMRRAGRRSHVHDVWSHPHVSSTPTRGKSYKNPVCFRRRLGTVWHYH